MIYFTNVLCKLETLKLSVKNKHSLNSAFYHQNILMFKHWEMSIWTAQAETSRYWVSGGTLYDSEMTQKSQRHYEPWYHTEQLKQISVFFCTHLFEVTHRYSFLHNIKTAKTNSNDTCLVPQNDVDCKRLSTALSCARHHPNCFPYLISYIFKTSFLGRYSHPSLSTDMEPRQSWRHTTANSVVHDLNQFACYTIVPWMICLCVYCFPSVSNM